MTQIVGILRYSVLSTSFNPFKKSKRLSVDDYVARILAPERLHRRRILLETMVLPSLDAQTDRDFKLLIVAPRLLPKREKAKLKALGNSRDYVRIVYVHERKFRMRHLSPLILDEMVSGDGAFLTFRIDDDDAVADSYVARMRRYIDPAFDDMCVSLCRGQLVDIGTTADAIGVEPALLPNASVGLGYVSTRAAPRTIFDVTDRHHWMHKRRPVITDGREEAFILTTHGENDTGARRLLKERNLPPATAQRQLRKLGFHVDLRRLARRLGRMAADAPAD